MSDQTLDTNTNNNATDASTGVGNQGRTYTQEEFDNHMAGLKAALTKKFTKQYEELGDINELKQLKATAEQQKQQEALKRGEFEKILQEKAAHWQAELSKRDSVIKEYKVNEPLLNAASKYRSVNPDQVRTLLAGSVRLNDDGEVEVLDSKGSPRYTDTGQLLSVDQLVNEFLTANPHFVQPGTATTNTKTNVGQSISTKLDIKSLDMRNPADRQKYKEARAKGLI